MRSCFEFLQKVFPYLMGPFFMYALGDFLVLFVPVLRQIARYLPHHRSKNDSKTHPKSSHDKFKTASEKRKRLCRNKHLYFNKILSRHSLFCLSVAKLTGLSPSWHRSRIHGTTHPDRDSHDTSFSVPSRWHCGAHLLPCHG